MKEFFLIVFSTLISEDLTSISVGILVNEGKLNAIAGTIACTTGIFIGDYLLFLTGKQFFSFLKKRERFQFLFESNFYKETSEKLTKNYAKTIFLCRFMPGTRLPIYTFAGMISKSSLPFLFYSFIASIIWTPAIVFLAYYYGEAFKKIYETNDFALYILLCIGSLFLIYQFLLIILVFEKRRNFLTQLGRISRLEFWPIWVFYIPIVPYVAFLTIRYRSFMIITASNPAMPLGGIAMESKSDILASLNSTSIAKFKLIKTNFGLNTEALILQAMTELNIHFPFILKPDIGERGAGVTLIHDIASAVGQINKYPVDYILQQYHPGPFEAGIFYYRYPNEPSGKIFSITDKIFPILTGDGISNIRDLIYTHPRFKYQAKTFFTRMAPRLNDILGAGENLSLGFAGNHIQGCMFKDGSHLNSKELEKEIDSMSKTFKGFYFGRYDVRYSSVRELMEGKNFKVIELNGAMSESTNLYDPDLSIFRAYQILFRQWAILFKIGHQNNLMGLPKASFKNLYHLLREHRKYKSKLVPISPSYVA